ncbi:MAG: hypothetical protein PVH38_12650, partial [Gammaproteobacteria bacterium]
VTSRRVLLPGSVIPSLLLLLCCLPAVAGWGQREYPLPASELDRAFELEAYHLLTRRLGLETTRYVRITRFGNTILITGMVPGEEAREKVETVVMEVAGIRREAPGTAGVVPERTHNCGGRVVTGNVRRKQIVDSKADCSALRATPDEPATGRLFNHLELISSEPDRQTAAADMLAAQARYRLVEAGYMRALDRDVMRLASQGSTLYVLMRPDPALQSEMRTVLLQVPGVTDVHFYTE